MFGSALSFSSGNFSSQDDVGKLLFVRLTGHKLSNLPAVFHHDTSVAHLQNIVKIVADKRYDEVLGVHMIGLRSTELVAEATLALGLESTVEELIRTIHAHPTMAEAIGEAAHAAHGAAIHM